MSALEVLGEVTPRSCLTAFSGLLQGSVSTAVLGSLERNAYFILSLIFLFVFWLLISYNL